MIKRIKDTRAELYKKLNDLNDKNISININDDDDDNYINNDNLKLPRGNSIISNNIISDNEAETIKGTSIIIIIIVIIIIIIIITDTYPIIRKDL